MSALDRLREKTCPTPVSDEPYRASRALMFIAEHGSVLGGVLIGTVLATNHWIMTQVFLIQSIVVLVTIIGGVVINVFADYWLCRLLAPRPVARLLWSREGYALLKDAHSLAHRRRVIAGHKTDIPASVFFATFPDRLGMNLRHNAVEALLLDQAELERDLREQQADFLLADTKKSHRPAPATN